MLTLLCHFYNERLLLPYFCKHHYPMFDHGIMIDYGSTDNSVELIKQYAPNWEVRPSRNPYFHEPDIGHEVMDIERTIPGWKICLNTTEFLLHDDLRGYTSSFTDPTCLGIRQAILFDREEDREDEITDEPLFFQKHYGYVGDHGHVGRGPRYLHSFSDGAYQPGRHSTMLPATPNSDLLIAWFGLCPWKWVDERRSGQKSKINKPTMPGGLGFHLFWSDEYYENFFKSKVTDPVRDLLLDGDYANAMNRVRRLYGGI